MGGCFPQSAWRTDGAILVLQGRRPPRHRGAAPCRADLGAGEHLFRLPGHRPAALPPGAPAQGQEPSPRAGACKRAEEPSPASGLADTGLAKALRRLGAGVRGKTRDLETRFRFSRFCHKELARERETDRKASERRSQVTETTEKAAPNRTLYIVLGLVLAVAVAARRLLLAGRLRPERRHSRRQGQGRPRCGGAHGAGTAPRHRHRLRRRAQHHRRNTPP